MKICRGIERHLSSQGSSATILAVFFLFMLLGSIDKTYAAESCESAVARIISIQGMIELRRTHQTSWQPAVMQAAICPGDTIRARSHSRAALLLSNASVLRLDQKTSMTFPKAENSESASLLDLFSGAIHIITRTPKPFKIRTPFVNAGVDGTEFFAGVDDDSAKLVIFEGTVSVSNDQGSLSLSGHEAAITARGTAPRKISIINPSDAVQWALYYPAIIHYQSGGLANELTALPELTRSIELYRQGKAFEALALLDAISPRDDTVNLQLYRAGLLLAVGQADEARTSIGAVLAIQPDNSDAHALLAMIAVVQNDKELALELAARATALNTSSPAAILALSYAQQAHFKIEEALASVQQATAADPDNALAWARLAELQMSAGNPERALEAAQQAVNLNSGIARTQTVLGFAHLLQIHTQQAKTVFSAAIMLDQTDPMPRLGMGLALIREGKLETGRIELEIAASLDPASSLIRSYLGKAYFEEKRYSLAGTQFDLAKEKDPNDPTPWFYDAIQKQTQNRPIEALRDIQQSIELNHNRAVYRSKFLLDQDEAARGSSLARIYDNLGFEKRALVESAKSLSIDPVSHSAHRFLSDAYMSVPQHEIARVSELLQAQLLQPININPVQPHLAVADLNIITATGPSAVGFNEFSPLLERNRPQLVASGIAGSQGTLGNEAVFSALYDRTSISLGQFHHETNGFRENNDQKHNIYNAFIQHALTNKFNIQAEIRIRNTEHGDLILDGDPKKDFSKKQRRELEQDFARLGSRYQLTPQQDVIASVIFTKRNENRIPPNPDIPVPTETSFLKDTGYMVEVQHLFRNELLNTISGFNTYQVDVKQHVITDFSPIGNQLTSERDNPNAIRDRSKGYIYTNFNFIKNLNLTLGFSYDSFSEGEKNNALKIDKFNPKFGLQYDITSNMRLRLAWFETVKSALIANQTLEPTQVAGFNQFFDDFNGTKARRNGAGLDMLISKNTYAGIEASTRHLESPVFLGQNYFERQNEELYQAYIYWLPHPNWSIKGESKYEKYTRKQAQMLGSNNDPTQIENWSFPVNISFFSPLGFQANLTGTNVWQNLQRPEGHTLKAGTHDFFILDAAIGYRLPKRRGIINFGVNNILDQEFTYRSYNFQLNEYRVPRFIPTRAIFASINLNF